MIDNELLMWEILEKSVCCKWGLVEICGRKWNKVENYVSGKGKFGFRTAACAKFLKNFKIFKAESVEQIVPRINN